MVDVPKLTPYIEGTGRNAMEQTPIITRVLGHRWDDKPSRHLVLEVESSTQKLALRVSNTAAVELEEAIHTALQAGGSP